MRREIVFAPEPGFRSLLLSGRRGASSAYSEWRLGRILSKNLGRAARGELAVVKCDDAAVARKRGEDLSDAWLDAFAAALESA